MKYLIILPIILYQKFFSAVLKNILGVNRICRYSPTCSEYTKEVILKFGVLKGGYKGLVRIFSCQPFIKINSNG